MVGQNVCLYYDLNKFFCVQHNLWEHKNIWGNCPRMPPHGYGPRFGTSNLSKVILRLEGIIDDCAEFVFFVPQVDVSLKRRYFF